MIQSRGRVSSLDDVWQAFLPPLPSPSIPVKDTRGEDADLRLVYAGVSRLPPPSSPTPATLPISEPTGPLRVALVLNTFAFGGSETEAIELIQGADPTALSFTGIAVAHPLRLPRWKSPADTPFPKLIMPPNPHIDPADTRIVIAGDFRAAVRGLVQGSDIIVSWGLARLQEYLPPGSRPPLVAVSKDSGDWARSVLYPNALGTRHLVANSSTSAEAFPRPVRTHVHVIHNGINPNRIEARLSRAEQRHAWGLSTSDPVVGYLGRIEHDKGVDKVVAAVAQLPSEWKAVFIGVTPNSRYAGELKRACEQVLPRRYRLLGWTHDVGSALAAFDVFCHPSEHEGFSNSIGEAWLAGVPTVYTANTGAVGDVGELRVSVSPTADGHEVATAIVLAHSKPDLAARARQVMMREYPPRNNVDRWTEYLQTVCRGPFIPRIMVLVPRERAASLDLWAARLLAEQDFLDLACVAVEDDTGRELPPTLWDEPWCPVFRVSGPLDVATLLRYIRADAIFTFMSAALDSLLRSNLGVPIVVVPPDPEDSGLNSQGLVGLIDT